MQTELFGDREIKEGMPSQRELICRQDIRGSDSIWKTVDIWRKRIQDRQTLIREGDRELFEDILANTISRKIRGKINSSISWVKHESAHRSDRYVKWT